MSENSLHITDNNIKLLKFLASDPYEEFSHEMLAQRGFDLSEESYALIRHLVRREGYNKSNYIYKILPNGIGYIEEFYTKENLTKNEHDFKERTIEVAEDANKKSHRANIISLWAIIVPSLLSIASLIISIISLLRGQG